MNAINKSFDFRDLFVLDLANNHQGSVQHATLIIREMGKAVRQQQARAALKFQFRQFEAFIHPSHKQNSDNKHIPRFLANALTDEEFRILTDEVRKAGMLTMATPFDEESVDLIDALDIELIKIASCSATDWPLLERVAEFNKPVVVSTGGLTYDDIDNIVSFLDHRRVQFSLMHCVAIYPTPLENLQLNQISALRVRHPDKVIGFSTHEDPTDISPVMVAVAKGAQMLERHVAIPTEQSKLNAYSSTPERIAEWIAAARKAQLIGGVEDRPVSPESERSALLSLKRGVFARKPLKAGDVIRRDEVYFAMPMQEGQLVSGEWEDGIRVRESVEKDQGLMATNLELPPKSQNEVLVQAIHELKSMLNEARIALPTDFSLEFSHHYGKDNFRETGGVLIDCVNRGYCKKLIIQLPGQYHPAHYHKRKEETFQVLSGVLEAEIEGRPRVLLPGDTLVVPQGVWHSFWTKVGVIFEEISSTHYDNDSYYEDKKINSMARQDRKTIVSQWGRYQL